MAKSKKIKPLPPETCAELGGLWVKWLSKGVVESDEEFNRLVDGYQLFEQLYSIFRPEPPVSGMLANLRGTQQSRKSK